DPVIVREELEHHVIATDVSLEAVAAIETSPSLFPGVLVRTSSERVYPQGDTASHIVGVRTKRQPDESSNNDDAARPFVARASFVGDRVGRNGIERSFDLRLRGRRGTRQIIRDRGGEIISQEVVDNPQPGE